MLKFFNAGKFSTKIPIGKSLSFTSRSSILIAIFWIYHGIDASCVTKCSPFLFKFYPILYSKYLIA